MVLNRLLFTEHMTTKPKKSTTPKKKSTVTTTPPGPTVPYVVVPSTASGVLLKSNAFSAGYQSGGVSISPLQGTVTWSSIDTTAESTKSSDGGDLITDYIVVPNSSQAFQVKGTFSTDSEVPIQLKIPGYFINDTLDEVNTKLFIPANNVKQLLLFKCYINDSSVSTLNFKFDYVKPKEAGVKKFKVFLGNDITITRINGDPSPVAEQLYPQSTEKPGKYTIKSAFYKSIPVNPYGAGSMFLCSHQSNLPGYPPYCTGNQPDKSSNHFLLNPVSGTTNVYTIQNVGYKELSVGSFLSGAGIVPAGIEAPILWFSDKNDTCEWIVKQVNKGENLYTFQNVKTKVYLAAWSYMISPVNGKDPTASVAQWYLNLA
jgi:hypothetical protein